MDVIARSQPEIFEERWRTAKLSRMMISLPAIGAGHHSQATLSISAAALFDDYDIKMLQPFSRLPDLFRHRPIIGFQASVGSPEIRLMAEKARAGSGAAMLGGAGMRHQYRPAALSTAPVLFRAIASAIRPESRRLPPKLRSPRRGA